jgi:enoyl-CoA hydratase
MALANVLIERRGRVARVTINRPDKLNALNIATRNDIPAAFAELERDDDVRVVIITGAGDKAFVAGADISEFAGMTAVGQRAVMKARVFDAVEGFSQACHRNDKRVCARRRVRAGARLRHSYSLV